MSIRFADIEFDRVDYDREVDVLYLHAGDPSNAADWDESPEGHGLSFDANGRLVGAVGVSGDSSCADHNIAWRTRNTLGLDYVPAGVSGDATRPDNIVYDITPQPGQMPGVSAGGWGHPVCTASATSIAATLPPTQ